MHGEQDGGILGATGELIRWRGTQQGPAPVRPMATNCNAGRNTGMRWRGQARLGGVSGANETPVGISPGSRIRVFRPTDGDGITIP